MPKSSRRTKGDGSLYRRADGMWVGSVEMGVTADGRRRRKVVTHSTHAGALEKLRKARRDVEVHGVVPTRSVTVEQWLARWLDEICAPRVKPRTLDSYRSHARLVGSLVGSVRLDKLSASHVRKMRADILRPAPDGTTRSSTTALHCHRLLSKALKDGVREGVVLRNVAELTDAPAKVIHEARPLSGDQARDFLRYVSDDPMAARWALALIYGTRQGESLGLTWDAVNFDDEWIDLEWQLQRLTWRHGCARPCGRKPASCPERNHGIPAGVEYREVEGAWVLTRPKRGKRRRVPLIPQMAAFLRLRLEQAKFDPNPHGLVFARPDGMPLAPTADNAAWHANLDALGFPSTPLHDARHTAATLLLELGVDANVIQAILGHSDVLTTRGYQTVSLSLARTALEGLGRSLEA